MSRLGRYSAALSVIATLFATLLPSAAQARVTAPQEQKGNVILPAPGPNGETAGGCWTGLGRRAWVFSGGYTAGPFGSMFEVDEATWNGKFKLEVTGGAMGTEDLDITFYADPAGVYLPDTGPNGTGSYLTRKPGGEVGRVPPGSNVALICLSIGSGADVDYSYIATPPRKKR